MLEMLMWAMWLIPMTVVWRRVGYILWHKWHKTLCINCRNKYQCATCGDSIHGHFSYLNCDHEFVMPDLWCPSKALVLVLSGMISFYLWPAIVLFYIMNIVRIKTGIASEFSFFKAPPVIETADQKRERILTEREQQSILRETAILTKEKELGLI